MASRKFWTSQFFLDLSGLASGKIDVWGIRIHRVNHIPLALAGIVTYTSLFHVGALEMIRGDIWTERTIGIRLLYPQGQNVVSDLRNPAWFATYVPKTSGPNIFLWAPAISGRRHETCHYKSKKHVGGQKKWYFAILAYQKIFFESKMIFQVCDPGDSCDDSIALPRSKTTLGVVFVACQYDPISWRSSSGDTREFVQSCFWLMSVARETILEFER